MSFRPIWGKPHLISDWGEEQEERETHWTALFYDLIIVASVMSISDPFVEGSEEETDEGGVYEGMSSVEENEESASSSAEMLLPEIRELAALDALLKFLSILMLWNYLSDIYSRFEDESLAGHLAFFVHSFGMACAAAGCVGDLGENYFSLGNGIIIARLGLIVLYIRPLMYIPRARVFCVVRTLQQLIVVVAIYASIRAEISLGGFRQLLAAVIVWDWISIPAMVLLKHHRLPVHVGICADRVKDGIMVIFGEAILMLALKRRIIEERESAYYYTALALSLWLVYSMALHEYHIYPSIEDHALRRSVLAGTAWFYTSCILQCLLLGAAIGVKRIHLLVGAGVEEVDNSTIEILVWGITGVLLCVVIMRFCHFGMGKHPSKHDPPLVATIKYFWWISMLVLSSLPYVLSVTVISHHPSPLKCLSCFSIMMGVIVFLEAALSNVTVYMTYLCTRQVACKSCTLQSFVSEHGDYGSIGEENYLRPFNTVT